MSKVLCISISNWVFNEYLAEIKSNRSKFIEEMIVKGVQQETGETDNTHSKIYNLFQELKNKDEEIKKLSLLIGSLKSKLAPDEDLERKALERIADGFKANNPLRDE